MILHAVVILCMTFYAQFGIFFNLNVLPQLQNIGNSLAFSQYILSKIELNSLNLLTRGNLYSIEYNSKQHWQVF